MSTLLFSPIGFCNDYCLRLTSLLCSIINFTLLYKIRTTVNETVQRRVSVLEALTISLLPPLYFFSHLYYTDVPALTLVLLMILFSLKGMHALGSLAAIGSVAMRQTNIIWVGMILGVNILNFVVNRAHPFLSNKLKSRHTHMSYTWKDLLTCIDVYLHRPDLIWNHMKGIIIQFYGYISVILGFLAFLWYNGSIVIGDKTAHQAALHLPQVCIHNFFLYGENFRAVLDIIFKFFIIGPYTYKE